MGMVKLMRLLSVTNPVALAALVVMWGRAAMMEGHAVGGAVGVAFAVVLMWCVSAAMWAVKGVSMLVKPVAYLVACVLLAVALATVPGGGVSRAWGAVALVGMGADRLLAEVLGVIMRARMFESFASRRKGEGVVL